MSWTKNVDNLKLPNHAGIAIKMKKVKEQWRMLGLIFKAEILGVGGFQGYLPQKHHPPFTAHQSPVQLN